MPGYMNGSKKARHTASITNFRQVGIKSGLAPTSNATNVMFRGFRIGHAQNTSTVPNTPQYRSFDAQINFLRSRRLVSVNPVGSAAVGRRYPIARLAF